MSTSRKALVLFSGGQDSTVCLAWALARFAAVETVGFDYGQRHRVELDCRPRILAALRAQFPAWRTRLGEDHVLEIPVLGAISDTALTRERAIALSESGLPNTFVPGRNLLFLTLAAALAWRHGIGDIVAGMGETDYSGYPDCRDPAIRAMERALAIGMDFEISVHTPLMRRDKAGTWKLARKLGGEVLVEIVREETHSCYLGDRDTRHDWGYGCGACPACVLRQTGYRRFMAAAEIS